MQRAMARQAEAERERRAKVIHAEGELQAAATLSQAAGVISTHPAALQLRYLQTLAELGGEGTSTVVFPLPIDLVRPMLEATAAPAAAAAPAASEHTVAAAEEPGLLPPPAGNGAPLAGGHPGRAADRS